MEKKWMSRLREQMEAKGFTMKSLSAAAGQNETYVRDILVRSRVPTLDKFISIAEALGVPASYLLGEDASSPVDATNDTAQLRSALLAYGVDRKLLNAALLAVEGFRIDSEDDGQSPRGPAPVDIAPASRRRAKEPSR